MASVLAAFVLIGIVVVENFFVAFGNPESKSVVIFDQAFSGVLCLLWISFHAFVVVGTREMWFYLSWSEVEDKDDSFSERKSLEANAVIISLNGEEADQNRRSHSSLRRRSSAEGVKDSEVSNGTAL